MSQPSPQPPQTSAAKRRAITKAIRRSLAKGRRRVLRKRRR